MWDLRRAIEDSGQNILPKDPDHQLAGIGAFNLGNVYEGESALIVYVNTFTFQYLLLHGTNAHYGSHY